MEHGFEILAPSKPGKEGLREVAIGASTTAGLIGVALALIMTLVALVQWWTNPSDALMSLVYAAVGLIVAGIAKATYRSATRSR